MNSDVEFISNLFISINRSVNGPWPDAARLVSLKALKRLAELALKGVKAREPVYCLIRYEDTIRMGHGGDKTIRNFSLLINGRVFKSYSDDSAASNWDTGTYLDRRMDGDIAELKSFFGGTSYKGRVRSVEDI